ncbi:MAG: dolichol kinase [Halobaculum sp.]
MVEWRRRAVHASGTAFPAVYLLGLTDYREFQLLLLVTVAVVLALEFLRLVVGVDHRVYEELTREYEKENVAGYALFFVGATAAAVVFRPAVAVPAILMLSIGDPISGILGSAEAGTAKELGVLGVMFLVCFAIALPFAAAVAGRPPTTLAGVAVAASGALGATLADGVKPVIAGYVVDDNLSIPPAASLAMWVVLRLV